jgi:hypothetical protein
MSRLIDFYNERLMNPTCGLTYTEMLSKGDVFYIGTTNWITWLFPSKKRSCSLDSIIATDEELAEFRSNRRLQSKVIHSLQRVLDLYGFRFVQQEGSQKIVRTESFEIKAISWLQAENPNLNRIARILQSLMLIGMENVAEMWLEALEELARAKPEAVADMLDYWRASVRDPTEWKRGGRYGKAGGF